MGIYRHETRFQQNRSFRVCYFRRLHLSWTMGLFFWTDLDVSYVSWETNALKYLPLILYWGYATRLLEHGGTVSLIGSRISSVQKPEG
jgi:hypothetical protein